MASKGGVSGTGVFVFVAGSILVWSGVKNKSVSQILQALIAGQDPNNISTLPALSPATQSLLTGSGGQVVPSGKLLTPKQIYSVARQAGFNSLSAVVATAVALTESGGKTTAHCLNCVPGITEDSRGLWQINVDAHPQYRNVNLYDPLVNAQAAFQVSGGGTNFSPWSTFTSGAYLGNLGRARAAANG